MSQKLTRSIRNLLFPGSARYWEKRYRKEGNSGKGSYGKNAAYKANFLNEFVARNDVRKVIEFGCGDGNQLKQFHFPEYIGLDVSPTIIQKCKTLFESDRTKQFFHSASLPANKETLLKADLVLSLDVIYHLVEDEVFESYMRDLFAASTRFVIIYAWDVEEGKKYHVRHRHYSKWIENNIEGFNLINKVSNQEDNFCDFFVYEIGSAS